MRGCARVMGVCYSRTEYVRQSLLARQTLTRLPLFPLEEQEMLLVDT